MRFVGDRTPAARSPESSLTLEERRLRLEQLVAEARKRRASSATAHLRMEQLIAEARDQVARDQVAEGRARRASGRHSLIGRGMINTRAMREDLEDWSETRVEASTLALDD